LNGWIIVIGALWIGGTCLRAYRQTRFYQIEEYMSARYLRWMLAVRARAFPTRPVVAWFIGTAMLLILTEAPDSFMPGVIAVIAGLIAVYPPDEGEIKKQFRPTSRAKRLLAATFALIVALGLALFALVNASGLTGDFLYMGATAAGFALFIAAPLWLIAGNLLMTPVEAAFRRRFIASARRVLAAARPTVIGITGSYGKTSTKTYLAHILNGRYRAYPTPKSYNTMMGVSMAINNDLAGDHSIDYFIAEMGAYIPGEIARLCDLTHPHIGIIVEVGPQHLERFGSLENIAIAKYELIKGLPSDGVGVFNWDNPHVRAMFERGYPATRIAVSRTIDPQTVTDGVPRYVATDVRESLDGLRFTVTDTQTRETLQMVTPLLGAHNVTNILLAAASAAHEGMTLREIAARVRTLQPAESRLVRNVLPNGLTIINDAYSANPVGIVHALRVLSMHDTGRRALITPGMVELGALMEQENRKLGEIAAQHATDVILVGTKQAPPIHAGLIAAGFPADRVQTVETLSAAVEWYQRNLGAGDTVLFLNDLPDTYSS
jgi:UDP-N-acetylmuramoyl-tripeptide--D-alanyl-D-alanine ligase